MGLGRFLEGAPKADPEFVLPPEPEDQPLSDEELLRRDRGVKRSIKALFGIGALVVVGSGALLAIDYANGKDSSDTTAAAESNSPSASPSASPTPTTSPSPTQTSERPTPSAKAASPTHVPSPSITTSHRVVTTPRPTHSSITPSHPETSKPAGACS